MASDENQSPLVVSSLGRHLLRGAIGFALIGSALLLSRIVGPAALLIAPVGLIALRGCPACWTAGLIEMLSTHRRERRCGESRCGHTTTYKGTASVVRKCLVKLVSTASRRAR